MTYPSTKNVKPAKVVNSLFSSLYYSKKNKDKKMGFFNRWLLNKVRQADREDSKVGIAIPQPRDVGQIEQPERAIRFTVYSANGGRVVETNRYDRKTDRTNNGLYIITSDQDFGKEIDKIITLEALK